MNLTAYRLLIEFSLEDLIAKREAASVSCHTTILMYRKKNGIFLITKIMERKYV
jgi:hypothetical protein